MDIPIMLRSNELRQLRNWVPEVCGALQRAGLDEQAERLQHIHEDELEPPYEHVDSPAWVSYVSIGRDDWASMILNLDRIKDEEGVNRVWYVQKKLSNRIRQRMEELDGGDNG